MPTPYQVDAALEALWHNSKRVRDSYERYRLSPHGVTSHKAFWSKQLLGSKADSVLGFERDDDRPKKIFKEWEYDAMYAVLEAVETVTQEWNKKHG